MDDKNEMNPGVPEASAPTARASHTGGGGAEAGAGRCIWARKELTAVHGLMRGERLEALSRELDEPMRRLSGLRDRVMLTTEGALNVDRHGGVGPV